MFAGHTTSAPRDRDLLFDTKMDGARRVLTSVPLAPTTFSFGSDRVQAQVQILEAQPALLATPRGRVNATKTALIQRFESGDTLHWMLGGVIPADPLEARQEEEHNQARERERLWHVACTRARDLLILPQASVQISLMCTLPIHPV